MSFNPLAYPVAAYIGTQPVYRPINMFDKATQAPCFVPLTFDWSLYFAELNGAPNISVPMTLNSGSVQGGYIDHIKGIKIDNSNSSIQISVYFPSTGDLVLCPPQSVITYPVMANDTTLIVIAQGLSVGFTPMTKIFLCNYYLPPSVDPQLQLTFPQFKGSPAIQRNGSLILTPGYGAPALIDQTKQTDLQVVNGPDQVTIFAPVAAGGFWYIGGITLNAYALGVTPQSLTMETAIIAQGPSGPLYRFHYEVYRDALPKNGVETIYSQSGMNLKLNAGEEWILYNQTGTSLTGNVQLILNYSYNPL